MDNISLFFYIFNLHNLYPQLTRLMIFITGYGVYISIVLALIIAVIGRQKEKKAAFLMIISLAITLAVTEIIKIAVGEPRPFTAYHFQPLVSPPTDFSFPSGHSANMAAIAFSFLFTRSRWAILFFILMLLIGFSRIYLGVHYPIDVLAGFALGFIISFSLGYLLNKLQS